MNNNDSTFKKGGWLQINVINNNTLYFADIAKGNITCPPSHPWSEGKDYYLHDFVQKEKLSGYVWYLAAAYINSRGPDKVAKGDTYTYFLTIQRQYYCFLVDIIGVEGGSVLRPAIGLYNLTSKPHDWTYFRPEQFSGEWGLQVIDPQRPVPVGLSVSYNPGQECSEIVSQSWSQISIRLDNYLSRWAVVPSSEAFDEAALVMPQGRADQPMEVLCPAGTIEVPFEEAAQRVLEEV